jgi:hypothetical protein
MSKRKDKGSWIVTMRCTVTKEVVCENCTEEEARDNPFEHAVSEEEMGQEDWEVTHVEPNN